MSRAKRPWGVMAGPIVLALGLAAFWGAKSAMAMKEQVMDWSYQLEYSPEPVTMQMPDVPLLPPLIINDDRMGRIDLVVIQRDRPGAVDSITILADVPDQYMDRLEDCKLRLRISSFDFHGYGRALRCTTNVDGLISFGHLNVQGSDLSVPILVRSEDLPCDHHGVHGTPCGKTTDRLIREIRSMQRELEMETDRIRVEVRNEARDVRREAREIRSEAHKIRDEVRTAVRSIR